MTSESVWPQKSSESLKNSPNILINHQKIKSSNSLMSAAGLLGPSLVFSALQKVKYYDLGSHFK